MPLAVDFGNFIREVTVDAPYFLFWVRFCLWNLRGSSNLPTHAKYMHIPIRYIRERLSLFCTHNCVAAARCVGVDTIQENDKNRRLRDLITKRDIVERTRVT